MLSDANNGSFYRHVGVYGVCVKQDQLLVIEKILGPYTGQFDLPGGRLEDYESLDQALKREFREETGLAVTKLVQLGVWDFNVLWTRTDNSIEHLHHVAIMYEVTIDVQKFQHAIGVFSGQDSQAAKWIPLQDVTPSNSSPLVLQAIQWLQAPTIPLTSQFFDYRK